MPDVANITGNIATLRAKSRNSVFGENQKKPQKLKAVWRDRTLRPSILSYLAIGITIALFAVQIIVANLFNILG